MKIIKTVSEMRDFTNLSNVKSQSMGFVPTMGSLHEGHIALVKKAQQENDVVVVSIFVNPIQFGPTEDYDTYPRDLDKDAELLEKSGVGVLFAPCASEMYPSSINTYVVSPNIGTLLEGAVRPIHFRGICTVVAKLFNIIDPDRAYFGEKDYQQVLVIKEMVKDLSMPIEIVSIPTVRDENNLALSSRNSYLSTQQRCAASILYKALQEAYEWIMEPSVDCTELENKICTYIEQEELAVVDLVAIRNAKNLEIVNGKMPDSVLILLFVSFGKAQLLDHLVVNMPLSKR